MLIEVVVPFANLVADPLQLVPHHISVGIRSRVPSDVRLQVVTGLPGSSPIKRIFREKENPPPTESIQRGPPAVNLLDWLVRHGSGSIASEIVSGSTAYRSLGRSPPPSKRIFREKENPHRRGLSCSEAHRLWISFRHRLHRSRKKKNTNIQRGDIRADLDFFTEKMHFSLFGQLNKLVKYKSGFI